MVVWCGVLWWCDVVLRVRVQCLCRVAEAFRRRRQLLIGVNACHAATVDAWRHAARSQPQQKDRLAVAVLQEWKVRFGCPPQ